MLVSQASAFTKIASEKGLFQLSGPKRLVVPVPHFPDFCILNPKGVKQVVGCGELNCWAGSSWPLVCTVGGGDAGGVGPSGGGFSAEELELTLSIVGPQSIRSGLGQFP